MRQVPNEEKAALLQSYLPVVTEVPEITNWRATYLDTYTEKRFWSSLGTGTCALTTNGPVWSWALPSPQGTFLRQTASTLIRRIFPVWPGAKRKCVKKITQSLDYAKNTRTRGPRNLYLRVLPSHSRCVCPQLRHKVRPT